MKNTTLCYIENHNGDYLMLYRNKKKNDPNTAAVGSPRQLRAALQSRFWNAARCPSTAPHGATCARCAMRSEADFGPPGSN